MQKTIDINTTQHVVITYAHAPLLLRFYALFLDVVIVLTGFFFTYLFITAFLGSSLLQNMGWGVLMGLLPIILFFCYQIGFEIRNMGQTPGKMIVKIKVVRLDGREPEWSDLLVRGLLQMIDFIFSFGLIGAILINTTGKSQRLGDMAANTTVIKVRELEHTYQLSDILRIASVENHQPTYPQVKKLSEQDMVYIKSVLIRYNKHPNDGHSEVLSDLVTHLMDVLDLENRPTDSVLFLKTLVRDYVVLTR